MSVSHPKSPRLDTAGGNPFAMTAHMLINTKSEGLGEGEDSPLSSPVLDESYKIRIPLSRSSLSPHSPEVGKDENMTNKPTHAVCKYLHL